MSKTASRLLTLLPILLLALTALPGSAAVFVGKPQRPLFVPGQLIVKYKAEAALERRVAALHDLAVQEEHPLGGIPRLNLITLPAGTDVMRAAYQLQASGVVEYAEPNYYRYRHSGFTSRAPDGNCNHPDYTGVIACITPDDSDFINQWYAESGNHADIGLTPAWGLFCNPSGGACTNGLTNTLTNPAKVKDFKIAIIDDGFDLTNPDLKANFVAGTSCTGSSNCVATSGTAAMATKTDGSEDHGTFVASTLGAMGDNVKSMNGVLWDVKIVPIKSDLTDSSIVNGIEYAVGRGDVLIINESFGGPVASQAEYDALAAARDAGILVVVSAGNSDSNNDRAGAAYPANYAGDQVIFPHVGASGNPIPGAVTTKPGLPNVIAVAASDDFDTQTSWTQWGSFNVGLHAPGELIQALQRGGMGSTVTVAGTSFSSPITAGVAGLVGQYLILNSNPLSPDWRDLKMHLYQGSERSQTGTLRAFDGRSATGRLNAFRALQDVTHGVIVVRGVTIDDSTSGNADGEIDPGESANMLVKVANVGPDETDVQGTLSYVGSGSLASVSGGTVDAGPINIQSSSGHDIVDGAATMSFPVMFGAFSGNQSLLFKLVIDTASGGAGIETRYFYLEAGRLANNVKMTGSLTKNAFDDFQDFHIDVPTGAKNLVIYSTTANGVDIDLIAMKGRLPQYLETLGVDNPGSDPEFQQYIEPNSQTSGRADGDESIAYDGLASPFDAAKRPLTSAGTYHVVVVNFTGRSNQAYTLTACYAPSGSDEISFDGNYEFDEAVGTAKLTLLRSGSTGTASVKYATRNGGVYPGNPSAMSGTNYTASNGTMSWGAGDSSPKTISIPIIDTGAIASKSSNFKHFAVLLSSPGGGATLGCIKSADVALGNPDTVIPPSGGSGGSSSGGSSSGGGSSGGGGGVTGPLSLLALAAALLQRRRRLR
jgi:hypothetical protein